MKRRTQFGILVFDDVEVLDFAGPFEVFSRTRLTPGVESRRSDESPPFNVFTVSPRSGPVAAQRVTSVCTGSLLLAKAGLLSGKRATTHWSALDRLAGMDDTITVDGGQRVVNDEVVTSAGVSAGIDMAFAVVARNCGREVADETARYIEYPFLGAQP